MNNPISAPATADIEWLVDVFGNAERNHAKSGHALDLEKAEEARQALRSAIRAIRQSFKECNQTPACSQKEGISLLNPDMPAQELRLHMGEMTAQEMRTARAAILWANSRAEEIIKSHRPPAITEPPEQIQQALEVVKKASTAEDYIELPEYEDVTKAAQTLASAYQEKAAEVDMCNDALSTARIALKEMGHKDFPFLDDGIKAAIKAEQAENQRLRDALQFYANGDNYDPRAGIESPVAEVLLDNGEIAQSALGGKE